MIVEFSAEASACKLSGRDQDERRATDAKKTDTSGNDGTRGRGLEVPGEKNAQDRRAGLDLLNRGEHYKQLFSDKKHYKRLFISKFEFLIF